MDSFGFCLRLKTKISLYLLVTISILLLFHTVYRRTTLGAPTPTVPLMIIDLDRPHIFSETNLTTFLGKLHGGYVKEMRASNLGAWAVRRGLNNMATLSTGDTVLMKERQEIDRFQGEIYSYYLNCYLEMWNVPPTAIRCIENRENGLGKNETKYKGDGNDKKGLLTNRNNPSAVCYIVTAYVKGIKKAFYITDYFALVTAASVNKPRVLRRLLEWSDLIVFDFLTGHSDRLLIMHRLIFPRVDIIRWRKKVSNLARISGGNGDLIFIDHEETFHRSYEKARSSAEAKRRQFFYLSTMTVFRRKTVERLCRLCEERDPAAVLEAYIAVYDPISFQVTRRLEHIDRTELKGRLLCACALTCHLLNH